MEVSRPGTKATPSSKSGGLESKNASGEGDSKQSGLNSSSAPVHFKLTNKVRDLRSRFIEKESSQPVKPPSNGASSTPSVVPRHQKRGKDFSQLLHAFSSQSPSNTETSQPSNKTQDVPAESEKQGEKRKVLWRADREDRQSDTTTRLTPERSQSVRLATSAGRLKKRETEGLERSSSFKSSATNTQISSGKKNNIEGLERSSTAKTHASQGKKQEEKRFNTPDMSKTPGTKQEDGKLNTPDVSKPCVSQEKKPEQELERSSSLKSNVTKVQPLQTKKREEDLDGSSCFKSTKTESSQKKKEEDAGLERSCSFKSSMAKAPSSPVKQTDATCPELSAVLSRRQLEVEKQQQGGQDIEDRRGDKRQARGHRFQAAALEEVIADSEVARALQARRKATDSVSDNDSNTTDQSVLVSADIKAEDKSVPCPEEVKVVGTCDMQKTSDSNSTKTHTVSDSKEDNKAVCSSTSTKQTSNTPLLQFSDSTTSVQHVESNVSAQSHLPDSIDQEGDKTTKSRLCQKQSSVQAKSNDSSGTAATQSTDKNVPKIITKRNTHNGLSSTATDHSEDNGKSTEDDPHKRHINPDNKAANFASDKNASVKSTINVPSFSSSGLCRTESVKEPPEHKQSDDKPVSHVSPFSSSVLRRTESLKESPKAKKNASSGPPRGKLTRTPSLNKPETTSPIVDPQLLRIMEQRRQRELEATREEEELQPRAGERPVPQRTPSSASEEIEQNIRNMQKRQQEQPMGTTQREEEEALCMSVADRISSMKQKLQETNSTQISTPTRPRQGNGSPHKTTQNSQTSTVTTAISTTTSTSATAATAATAIITTTSSTFSTTTSSSTFTTENATITEDTKCEKQSKLNKVEEESNMDAEDNNACLTKAIDKDEDEECGLVMKPEKEEEGGKEEDLKEETVDSIQVVESETKLKLDTSHECKEKEKEECNMEKVTDMNPDEEISQKQSEKEDTSEYSNMISSQNDMSTEHSEKDEKEETAVDITLQRKPEHGKSEEHNNKEETEEWCIITASENTEKEEEWNIVMPSDTEIDDNKTGEESDKEKEESVILMTSDLEQETLESSDQKQVLSVPFENVTLLVPQQTYDVSSQLSPRSRRHQIQSSRSCTQPVTEDELKWATSRTRMTQDNDDTDTTDITQTQAQDGDSDSEASEDRASPIQDLVLPAHGVDSQEQEALVLFLQDDFGGESTTDPTVSHQTETDSRQLDTKMPSDHKSERSVASAALQKTPEGLSAKRQAEGRHRTQPVTPDEMEKAQSATASKDFTPGGSISDRLNQLKTRGEESWKKRVPKSKDSSSPIRDTKRGDGVGVPVAQRPTSITDRLSKLKVSAEDWRQRVGESDAKQFTVEDKLSKTSLVIGSESPLVARIRASSRRDLTKLGDDSSAESSQTVSPSSPTREFLPKVPLPTEIIADPDADLAAEATEDTQTESPTGSPRRGVQETQGVRVLVPQMYDPELDNFFSAKPISDIGSSQAIDTEDFDSVVSQANERLQPVKKIRPTRKKKASSRNPLKTVSQFVEIQTEYTQVTATAAAEKHNEIGKKGNTFAAEALAALASRENFSKFELRKTDLSSVPAPVALRQNPYTDLMLLHIKGRRNTQTRLVEPSTRSINAGDCYVLVTPDKVIHWVGQFSNVIEKAKAAEVAAFIQKTHDLGYRGTGDVQTVDQISDDVGTGKRFWAALQGKKQCQACGPDEEDELYENSMTKTNMVYRLTSGALHPYEEYWGATPKYDMLLKTEVLVFDFGCEVYVWQGTDVTNQQRKQSMTLAKTLWDKGYDYSQCAINPIAPLQSEEDTSIAVKDTQRPSWAVFGKINQNMETILFREKFADWPDTSVSTSPKSTKTSQAKGETEASKPYDVQTMIPVNDSPVTLVLEGSHVGRGKEWKEDMQGFIKHQEILTLGTKVWHVQSNEVREIPDSSYGQFYSGDTYVVRWQYMISNAGLRRGKSHTKSQAATGRERYAYFFWHGQDSSINEQGASALMTVELDEEKGPQIRVVQGKEPPCFLNLFQGNMVVHTGKRQDMSADTSTLWRMFCLRGDIAGEVNLLEIPVGVNNLRSRSSVIVLNTSTGVTYVWHGAKSPQHTRRLTLDAVNVWKDKHPVELNLHKNAHIVVTELEEGEEKTGFWSALGDRDRSLYHSLLKDPLDYSDSPRLFHMSSVSTVFEVKEQMNPARLPGTTTPFPFFQSDLYDAPQPALFLLDVGHCAYLWQGWWPVGDEDTENVHTGSASARFNMDRRCAVETTLNYCQEKYGGEPEAYVVYAGVEPLAFQNLFPYWQIDTAVRDLTLQEGKTEGYTERVQDVHSKLSRTFYSLEELQERPFPEGVDPQRLESYLSAEDFENIMKMTRDAFYALPSWKQTQLKQAQRLF